MPSAKPVRIIVIALDRNIGVSSGERWLRGPANLSRHLLGQLVPKNIFWGTNLMQTTTEILIAISNLSDRHVLKGAPECYRQSFAEAAMRVYPANKRAKILQDKFFVPNDVAFTDK
jgi:hypothetical protein